MDYLRIVLLNSKGVIAVFFLNNLEKYAWSSNPNSCATSLIVKVVDLSNLFASSTMVAFIHAEGVIPVLFFTASFRYTSDMQSI